MLFFLITDLYFSTSPAVAQIFNPISELVIPIRIPRKETKGEIEIHPLILEAKIGKCSI